MASAFDTTLKNLGITRAATQTVAPVSSGKTTLDQADFLKLMTAQLQNQDPFNPTDNTQMVAQMAQFSSLAATSEMSSTLKSIAEKLGATTTADAVAYIGRTVLTPGTTAYGRTSGGIAGAVELDAPATRVGVSISNAAGEVLHSATLGPQAAGSVAYDWDGKLADGSDAGAGPFTVAVTAQNAGKGVVARNLVWAPVESVSTANGAPVLTLPGIGQVPVTAVRQIG
jgi:flagellar basal-body rod modification protein FlgD